MREAAHSSGSPGSADADSFTHTGEPAAFGPDAPRTDKRSLLSYAPVFVLLVIVADSVQFADTDLWGHVSFGQIMLHTRHLIRYDVFSYSAPGRLWLNHEWLAEVVMALFYNAMGVVGLKLLKFLAAAAVLTLLALDVAETGAGLGVQFGVLLAAAFGLQLQIQFRPQLFDYVFLAALLALLAAARRGRRAPLWLALPMMVLWANLHGGFFIGIVVLGVYSAVVCLQDWWNGRGYGRGARLLVLTLACALAMLINPYGIGEWQIVARSLRNPYTMGVGAEFQSFLHVLAATRGRAMAALPFILMLCVMMAVPVSIALAPSA